MTRGGAEQAYAHFKGKDQKTYIVYLDDAAAAENWKTDKSIPLAQVVGSFKIFTTHRYVLQPSHQVYPSLVINSHAKPKGLHDRGDKRRRASARP